MNKKGIIQVVLGIVPLIVLGVVAIALLGFLGLAGWFLTKNIFVIVGLALVIFGGLSLLKGIPQAYPLILLGLGLIALPAVFKGLSSITLASILP